MQHKLLKKVITSKTLHELQINNVGQHKHGVIHISNCVAIQKVTVTKVLQNNVTSAVPYSTRHCWHSFFKTVFIFYSYNICLYIYIYISSLTNNM